MYKKWLLIFILSLILYSCLTPFIFSFKAELEEVNRETGLDAIRFEDKKMGIDFIDHVTISGNHFDVGYQMGMLATKTIVRPKKCEKNAREFNRQIIEMYRKLYPAYLEKLKGIAKAFDMNLEDIDLRFMEREFFVNLGWLGLGFEEKKYKGFKGLGAHCSILAYNIDSQGMKKTIVGRNFGWLQPNGAIVRTELTGDYKTLGSTIICLDHWIMDGINEKGLFIGVMTVVSPEQNSYAGLSYPDSPAVDAHHMMRIILNTCSSVQEAITKTKSARIWFADEVVHFLLADASGAMCVFEFDEQGRLLIIYPDNENYLLSTNSWLYDTDYLARLHCWRYAVASNILGNNPLKDTADLFDVMRKMTQIPSNPYVQNNYVYNTSIFDYLQTLWTSLYNLENLTMTIHYWLDNEEAFYSYSLDN